MTAHAALAGGCTNVLYLCASEHNPARAHYSHVQRMEGVRGVTERRGLPLEVLEIDDWWDPEPIQTLLGTYTPQTAVICSNFYIADWLTAHVLAAGPDIAEMPLFSCDDARKPLLHMLRLTRAGFDRYGMGVRAARMILRSIREPEAPCPSELLEPQIIPSNTTPPPTGDSLPEGDPLAFVERKSAAA
jgi:DNA-binding LacI/PurR family transcriptional regulator